MRLTGLVFFVALSIHVEAKDVLDIVLGHRDKVTPTLNFTTKCFDGLGCYYNGPPFFDPISRPISLLPSDNPKERIKFLLFTPRNRNHSENYTLEFTEESIRNSYFNPDAKTMIYAHGWPLMPKQVYAIYKIKDAVLKYAKEYYNYIVVDWINYSDDVLPQVAANLRVVGTVTAKMIQFLVDHTNATPESFHIVGHSFGAHLAGYAGHEIEDLGQITALDAGGPYFFGTSKEVRLDPSDALFVNAIHTSIADTVYDGVGLNLLYGDENFYPNGGNTQPECGNQDPAVREKIQHDVIKRLFVLDCNHEKSIVYFYESIAFKNCTFIGTQCDSYINWKAGKCPPSTHPQAFMGIRAKLIPGLEQAKFYLDTGKSKPYCKTIESQKINIT